MVEHEYAATYAYYKVPIPWLQVKLLRLLQYYPPSGRRTGLRDSQGYTELRVPEDPTIQTMLQEVLQTIMNNCNEPSRNVQHNNAQHAVLFEAISLAIHIDTSSPLVNTAAVLLARFISSKETNVRYLGLDTMAHLAARTENLEAIKRHQGTIILSLRDKDISVRRRALDLLYSMCDTDNSELIVGELLRYLKVADYGLREEMVLKIAILTEKYANTYKWYVDTILELLSAAGDHVGEEVWYRVVQIVTNTEDLQAYAAKVVFEYLKSPSSHESLVKVGGKCASYRSICEANSPPGYILGEYGHLIANEAGYSPIEQFQVLHSKSQFCMAPTRALLLSTYIKWVNVFPEIKAQLVNVFERYRHVLDVELQQRACEFYALSLRPEEDELLQNVCEEIPPFPPRESALIGRLNKKHGDTEDKRTWTLGGKDASLDRQLTRKSTMKLEVNGKPPASSGDISSDITSSLLGLDMTSSPTNGQASQSLPDPSTALAAKGIPHLTAGPNIDRWFDKLLYSAEGVLYEDVQIQIGVKSRYQGPLGQVAVYVGNKMSAPLTSFTTTVHSEQPEALTASFVKIAQSTLAPRTQIQQVVQVECKKAFKAPPILVVSFLAGAHQTIAVRLPVVVTKFLEGVKLGSSDFFERWKLIGGPPREAQSIFPISLDATGHIDTTKQRQVVSGYGFQVLEGIDPNPSNVVGAGILHTSEDGKVGCLLRLEPNREAKVGSDAPFSAFRLIQYNATALPHHDTEHIGGCRQRSTEAPAEAFDGGKSRARREAG